MKLLEDRIRKDGKVLPGDILKIDSFLNHQVDVQLMDEIGKEFHELFKDTHPTKILTIESSGIAIASSASRCFGYVPVVFAKKTVAANMAKDEQKGTKPMVDSPALTSIMSDSAMPQLMCRSGKTFLKMPVFVALDRSASSTMISSCSRASSVTASP